MSIRNNHYQILVVGGGAAGISVSQALLNQKISHDIAVIEPSQLHYYQPMWTLVGAGIVPFKKSVKKTAKVMPKGVVWIKDEVTKLIPEENAVILKSNLKITYDFLVLTPGLILFWDLVKGLKEAIGKNGVCSIYSPETVQYTWDCLKNFQGGKAFFTFPNSPVKCGGAPQKIMYLAEDYFRKSGVRKKTEISYVTPQESIFAVKKYANALMDLVVKPRNILTKFQHHLVEIKSEEKIAVFENIKTKEQVETKFDLLHIVPPMGTADFIKTSSVANSYGFVDVDKRTTQHVIYQNIFSIGDASSLPTSKTAAAVRASFNILVDNLSLVMQKKEPEKMYDGYTSCPILTRYGRVMLAEFDYDLIPKETFPFNQAKERWSTYLLKRFFIPIIYWRGMMKGYKWPR